MFRKRLFSLLLVLSVLLSVVPAAGAAETGRSFNAETLLSASRPLDTAPSTFEAWLYFPEGTDVNARGGVILGNYYDTNRDVVSFEIYNGGNPRLYMVDSNGRTTNLVFSNVSVYNSAWNHLAIVLDKAAGKAYCYLNGTMAQSLSLSVTPFVPSSCLALGGDYRNGNGQYFKGQLRSVALYKDPRSQASILEDMAGRGDIPLAAWDLSQTADSYKDQGPYSYDLGLSNHGRSFYAGEHNTVSKSFSSVPNTVEAWIRFPANMDPATRGGVILGNYKDGAKGVFSMEIHKNGNPRLYYIDSSGTVVDKIFTNVNVYTGSWLHLAIVRDNSAKKAHCYVNGTLTQSLALNVASFAPSSAMVVGGDRRSNNVQYFKGQIRSVVAYADARTQEEVQTDKATMGSGDPLAYWDVRVAADRYADLSGKGYTIVRTQDGPSFLANDTYKVSKELPTLPKTLEAWICFPGDMDPTTRGGVILGNYPSTGKSVFSFEIYSKGQPRLYYKAPDGTVTNAVFNKVNVYTGQWIHLAVVQDASANALHCYVNGTLAQTLSMTVPVFTPEGVMCVGGDVRSNNEQYFKGRIRSVSAYADVRTETEIQADRSKLGNGDPLAYWNMSSAAYSYFDLSVNGYHLNKSSLWLAEKEPVSGYDYTFAVVGDTQIVARKDKENGTKNLDRVYDWILSQKESQNIQYVMGLGDITDGNTNEEWTIAKNAIHQLNGKIPYSLVRGNHDGSDKINATFNDPATSPYSSSYEGSFDGTLNNTWRTLTAGSNQIPYLILTLDYGPTDKILAWADQVVQAHPDHNVIVTTHAYLFRDGTTLDSGDVCPPSASNPAFNNGDQVWEKFVKKHENIVMVLSGHDPCAQVVVNQTKGDHGNVVTQLLIDPQGVDVSTLTGAVALLHFSADGSKVTVEYYSTLQEAYYLSSNQFEIPNGEDSAETCLYQLPAQYMHDDGSYFQEMSYVVKTAGGKILVIDGGWQNGNYDGKYLYSFLQQITGKTVPHVDGWFITHNHSDHYGAFLSIANLYPNGITVDAVYSNLPSAAEIDKYFSGTDTATLKANLSKVPNAAKKLKNAQGGPVKMITLNSIHSGKCNSMLDFDELHIDVLLTCDDVFWGCDNITTKYSATQANAARPAFSNKTLKEIVSINFNESSMVFRMTFSGKSVLITGDAAYACGVMLKRYHDANAADSSKYFNLKTDVVQLAHHGWSGLQKTVYTAIDPDVGLWPAAIEVYKAPSDSTQYRTYYARQWFTEMGVTNYAAYAGPHTFTYPILHSSAPVSIPADIKPFVFDAAYYANQYPDLREIYGSDESRLYEHFINYGIEEGRCASPYFDVKFYMNQNTQNFRETMKGDYEKAFKHFLANINSTALMKLSENFDAAYYAAQNPELKEAGITTVFALLDHYVKEGSKKNQPASHTFMDPDGVRYHSNCTIVPGVDATCSTAGKTWGARCGACGVTLVEQETIPVTSHSLTYTATGDTHTVSCSICTYAVTEAHTYVDGICICGEVEIKEPVVDEALVINHSLNLASDISINFAVRTDYLQDYANHYMVCEIPVYEGNVQTDTKTVTVEPVLSGAFYYYTLTGVTAVQMGDVITAQLHMEKEGQPYLSKVDTYSIAQYAYAQLDKDTTTDGLKALCADLLRYGKEAQVFKSYRTDALVDSAMTEAHRAWLSDAEAVTFGNTNETLADLENSAVIWAGKALDLDSKVSVRYVFLPGTYTGSIEDLTLKVRYINHAGEDTEITLTDPVLYSAAMNSYAFTFDGLLAAELRTVTDVAIYAGETRLSQTLRYSPDTYGNGKTGQLLTLCKVLFAYSDTAKAYFAEIG